METAAALGHNNPPSPAEALQAELATRNAVLLSGSDKLLASAGRAPTHCDSDAVGKDITALVKLISTNIKSLIGARVAEKEPFLSGGRTVDNFFNEKVDALEKAKATVSKPLADFLKREADAARAKAVEDARLATEQAQRELAAAVTLEQSGMKEFSDSAMVQAGITEQNATKLVQASTAKPAHLASVRSASGTASLRTRWVGTVDNRDAIDLEKLRQHIPAAALQTALNSFIAAGGRELKGATIKEQSDAVVR